MSQTLIRQTEKEIISSILEIILIHSSLDFENCKRIEKMWKQVLHRKSKVCWVEFVNYLDQFYFRW